MDHLPQEDDPRPYRRLDRRQSGQTSGTALTKASPEGAARLHESLGLPIIFVTGQTDSATRQRAAKVAPVAYLDKPVRPQALIAAVEAAIAARNGSV